MTNLDTIPRPHHYRTNFDSVLLRTVALLAVQLVLNSPNGSYIHRMGLHIDGDPTVWHEHRIYINVSKKNVNRFGSEWNQVNTNRVTLSARKINGPEKGMWTISEKENPSVHADSFRSDGRIFILRGTPVCVC